MAVGLQVVAIGCSGFMPGQMINPEAMLAP